MSNGRMGRFEINLVITEGIMWLYLFIRPFPSPHRLASAHCIESRCNKRWSRLVNGQWTETKRKLFKEWSDNDRIMQFIFSDKWSWWRRRCHSHCRKRISTWPWLIQYPWLTVYCGHFYFDGKSFHFSWKRRFCHWNHWIDSKQVPMRRVLNLLSTSYTYAGAEHWIGSPGKSTESWQ